MVQNVLLKVLVCSYACMHMTLSFFFFLIIFAIFQSSKEVHFEPQCKGIQPQQTTLNSGKNENTAAAAIDCYEYSIRYYLR